MIGSLRGVVLDRLPATGAHGAGGPGGGGEVLVEAGGVGYRVTVTPATLAGADVGEPVFLHVHTHVREDALVLYGFAGRDERRCFEALLGAHGVGPALALAIVSALGPPALHRALAGDDVDALTAVPGVGRKTAARLVLELKSRLDVATGSPGDGPAGPGPRSEVRAALSGLGYGSDEVHDAVRDLPDDGDVEDLLKAALRRLATGPGVRAGAAAP